MQFSTLFLLSQASLIAAGSAKSRRAEDDGSTFLMYAFGDGIGGLPIFTAGGAAYLGDHTLLNNSDAAPALLDPSGGSTWTAQPNTTTDSKQPPWSNLTFAIPAASSSSHEVTFIDTRNATSDVRTTGFTQFGAFIFVDNNSTGVESLWYALPSGTDGVWSLNWNDATDNTAGKVVLTLRDIKPTNQS